MREYTEFKELEPKDLRELQLKELEILIYFFDFCKKHNLRCFLAGGTLLGAVRHRGFIPWDDDVDLHMPRPDYEKLPELWRKFADTGKYQLCSTTLEKNYRHHAYAIVDKDTTLIERKNADDDIAQGVKIDVIPLDGAKRSNVSRLIQLFWASLFAIYNVQRMPENQGSCVMRASICVALWIVRNPKSRYKIWKSAERHMKKEDFDSSFYVKELVASFRTMQCVYPGKDFAEEKWLEFEGYKLPAHKYYKLYLENVYHDYMELPPENKRKPKSDVIYMNLDEGYEKFRGIYYLKDRN